MNIVYLIGNGFDINLDLKTSYSSFYKHYNKIESDSDRVKQLKKKINHSSENWSDLEEALGRYTSNINSTEEFDEIFIDIVTKLSAYIKQEESSLKIATIKKNLFFQQLSNPVLVLEPSDQLKYNQHNKEFTNQQDNVDIITFNYTRTIEKISEYENRHKEIGKKGPHHVLLRNIVHVHGYIDDRMILGVNDTSQIANPALHENEDITNVLIKSNCNLVSKQNIEQVCKGIINQARVICIFGSSMGITDKMWWEEVGNQLKKGSLLIIFLKVELNYGRTMNYLSSRIERKYIGNFLKKTALSEDDKKKVANNIIISINSDMFKILSKEES